jgi:hypothetical protein
MQLAHRGLVKVTQRQLGDVWLTEAGQWFLRKDCAPQGNAPVLSWTQMSYYLDFMRQPPPDGVSHLPSAPGLDDVMQVVADLDQIHQADNYLPIHHLRDKLQPPLSRQEVDHCLYQLQREGRIELSTLQDVASYSEAAIAAAIPQDIGGPLFFISVISE